MKYKERNQISDMFLRLLTYTPAQIVEMGLSSELEDYLHANHESIPDALSKEIMKALKMIP